MSRNKIVKWISLFFCLAVLSACLFSTTALSASAPGKVSGLKASAAKDAVKLTWSKTKTATGYYIYQFNGTDSYSKIATVKGGSKKTYTVKGLTETKPFTFKVAAFNAAGEGPASDPKSATPKSSKPGTVKLKLRANGNGFVTLYWKKTANTNGYQVLQKKADGTYKSLGTTTKKEITIKNLKNGERYTFVVRAYRKSGKKYVYGNLSNEKIGKPNAPHLESVFYKETGVHGMWYSGKMTKQVTVGGITFKKGQKITVTSVNSVQAKILVNKTQQIAVPRNCVSTNGFITDSKTPYTAAQAEAYVNGKGFSSATDYLIFVSLYKQHVHIFKGSQYHWTQVHCYKCASGRFKTPTTTGTGTCPGKIRDWIFDHAAHAWWATKLTDGQALHSILLWRNSNKVADPTLGKPASHGCVRIAIKDAKWVYDNVPVGTFNVRY